MAKKNIAVYLTDECVYLASKNNIYEEKVDKSLIINNRIAQTEEFYRFFNKILKKNKLNDSLLGKDIFILEYPNYLKSDKELIMSVFEKLSFNKVKFIKYNNAIDNDTINANQKNALITIQNKNYFLDYNNFGQNIKKEIIAFLEKQSKIKELRVIGNLNQIEILAKDIEERLQIKTFTYFEGNKYLIQKINQIIEK